MLVFVEKIPPPLRPQIFNDYAEQDAALAARERQADWVGRAVDTLAQAWKGWTSKRR
ncbi:hypothetical protein [Bradyrhizobium sp. dw_78]|uniref:hypothetical protein n=1 Tax=Bradyrhizobium sp. dw_78 TaxID=2719793 RepID=UPI001BD5D652|nr:hypothetical protein [Bradyrhizobium sp. dw_78]